MPTVDKTKMFDSSAIFRFTIMVSLKIIGYIGLSNHIKN